MGRLFTASGFPLFFPLYPVKSRPSFLPQNRTSFDFLWNFFGTFFAKKVHSTFKQSFPFSTGSFQDGRCKTQVFPVFHRFLHSRWRKTQRRFSAPLSGLMEFSTVFTPPTTTTRIVNSFCVQNDEKILPKPAKWRIRCGKQKGTLLTSQLPRRRVYLQDKDRERTCHEI